VDLPLSWAWVLPLVVVQLVRWVAALAVRVSALAYRPAPIGAGRARDVTVVVVAGDGTATLRRALESWLAAGVRQVIVLVGAQDVAAQRIVERYPVHVLRRRASGRACLAAGWQAATGELVALVRADAVWNPDAARQAAAAFADSGVGGVSMRENTVGTGVLARLVDAEMDLRGLDGAPAASRRGAVTRPGAAAVFRRSVLREVEADYLAAAGEAGWQADVDALAARVLRAGHGLVHQRPARTWRPAPGPAAWVQARLATDRAGWRTRGRALVRDGWAWRRPATALGMLAWMLAAPAALVGPAYLVAALVTGRPDLAVLVAGAGGLGRLVLLLPHLRRRPSSLPVTVLAGPLELAAALIRLAALLPYRARRPAPDVAEAGPVVIDPALRLRPVQPVQPVQPVRPRVAPEVVTLPDQLPVQPGPTTVRVPEPGAGDGSRPAGAPQPTGRPT
jgi:hypothetical protein